MLIKLTSALDGSQMLAYTEDIKWVYDNGRERLVCYRGGDSDNVSDTVDEIEAKILTAQKLGHAYRQAMDGGGSGRPDRGLEYVSLNDPRIHFSAPPTPENTVTLFRAIIYLTNQTLEYGSASDEVAGRILDRMSEVLFDKLRHTGIAHDDGAEWNDLGDTEKERVRSCMERVLMDGEIVLAYYLVASGITSPATTSYVGTGPIEAKSLI